MSNSVFWGKLEEYQILVYLSKEGYSVKDHSKGDKS